MHLIIDARLEQPHSFLRIRGRDGATRLHLDGHVLERLVAAGDLDLCALWLHDRDRERQCIAELMAATLHHFPTLAPGKLRLWSGNEARYCGPYPFSP